MGLAAREINWQGNTYMPLKLRGVLVRNGVRQIDLCNAVIQKNGRPLSDSALSMLMNWGIWPKQTSALVVRDQAEKYLRSRGVPDDEIATLWELDDADSFRNAHPAGIHVMQPSPKNRNTPEPDIEPMEVEMLTPAAKKHFGLFRDPFKDDVNGPEDVFWAADQKYIRETMYMAAKAGGFVAVVGESGAGKSVLRKDMLDRINRDQASIIVVQPRTLDKTRLTASAICEAIIQDLQPGSKTPRSLEAQARRVETILRESSAAGNSHVLVIEEAHDLSVACLKYLKRFWELEDGFKKLLAIILVGQPELKDQLDERRNYAAREVIRRIEVAELVPLDNHLQAYVAHKFARVNARAADAIDDTAYDAITQRLTRTKPGSRETVSQLYPLVVNNLVTRALNRAAELGVPRVPGDLVREL